MAMLSKAQSWVPESGIPNSTVPYCSGVCFLSPPRGLSRQLNLETNDDSVEKQSRYDDPRLSAQLVGFGSVVSGPHLVRSRWLFWIELEGLF